MSREIGFVGSRIFAETGGLHNILQHAAHIAVNILDIQGSLLHTFYDFIYLLLLSGLHQVITGMHLTDGGQPVANTNPVGHHHSLISPVVTQNLGQQVVITHGIGSVHLVV